ncbi:SSI family serine proteinase inhibitor [Actinosynnema sp. NPDC050436]|uniref:SSI family serine proteinase inhibitor n=1 Tax=Actinosynnema sp. NPDC050436 TaxID=3155659 RepID=UPI0033F7C276
MAPLPLLAAFAALIPTVAAPEATLVLSRTHQGTTQVTQLTCAPAGGGHPRAAVVCEALGPVGGQVSDLADGNAVCTLQYDPVTVTAAGVWRGEPREFTAEYANPCLLHADTGPVFSF